MLYVLILLLVVLFWLAIAIKKSKNLRRKNILIVKTTFPSEESANAFCKTFCELKLIACGSVYKIKSSFIWLDKIQTNDEFVAEVKTHCVLQEKLVTHLRQYHPYKLPQISFCKTKVEYDYYLWLSTSLNIEEKRGKKKKVPSKLKTSPIKNPEENSDTNDK